MVPWICKLLFLNEKLLNNFQELMIRYWYKFLRFWALNKIWGCNLQILEASLYSIVVRYLEYEALRWYQNRYTWYKWKIRTCIEYNIGWNDAYIFSYSIKEIHTYGITKKVGQWYNEYNRRLVEEILWPRNLIFVKGSSSILICHYKFIWRKSYDFLNLNVQTF